MFKYQLNIDYYHMLVLNWIESESDSSSLDIANLANSIPQLFKGHIKSSLFFVSYNAQGHWF